MKSRLWVEAWLVKALPQGSCMRASPVHCNLDALALLATVHLKQILETGLCWVSFTYSSG